MTPRTAVVLGGSVVLGIVSGLLGVAVSRFMIEHGLYDGGWRTFAGVLLTSVLGVLQLAGPVFASVATRVPFAGLATAAVIAVVTVIVGVVWRHSDLGPGVRDLLFTALFVLTVLLVDLVVLGHAGRALRLTPVLVAALGMALTGAVLTLVQLVVVLGGTEILTAQLRNPSFLVNVLLVDPGVLLGAAFLGWRLRPREQAPLPAAG